MKHILLAMIGAPLLASPSLASSPLHCNFTTECFESEACSGTAFSLELNEADEQHTLTSDAETVPVDVDRSDALVLVSGGTDSAFHLMTVGADGTARYSTHIFGGPLMVNYLGTCEGVE